MLEHRELGCWIIAAIIYMPEQFVMCQSWYPAYCLILARGGMLTACHQCGELYMEQLYNIVLIYKLQ